MRFGLIAKRADFLTAAIVFLASASGALWVYAAIDASREEGGVWRHILSVGQHEYAVMHGAQCVGFISLDFSEDKGNLNLLAEGNLRVMLDEQELSPSFNMDAGFNVLGQLGGAVIYVKSREADIKLGFLEIDPIIFSINAALRGRKFIHKWKIPGPIELKRVRPGAYRLHYKQLKLMSGSVVAKIIEQARADLNFAVVPAAEWEELCRQEDGARLNLSPLIARWRLQLEGLSSILGERFLGGSQKLP